MNTKLTLALVALITSSAFAAIPAVLPEFKNEKQLAEWRDEMAAKHEAATTGTEDHAFYTGKPYIASAGGYAFRYRSYNPDMARWTSEDPSGFPDGANCNYYSPIPTAELDFQGLSKTVIIQENYFDDIKIYYSHDQMRIEVGMDSTVVLNIRRAAYQEFQNTMAMTYSVGDQITKGKRQSVLTDIVSDSVSLRPGYPVSELTAISYADTTGTFDVGFTFHAYITSKKEYSYE